MVMLSESNELGCRGPLLEHLRKIIVLMQQSMQRDGITITYKHVDRSRNALADVMASDMTSFTGHLPASLSSKVALVSDPDSVLAGIPDSFSPVGLSSAYGECFVQHVDHPAMEVWSADAHQALLAGDGPMVLPGERIVGSMAEHLGP